MSQRLVSIAVEWDNIRLAEADRSVRMLAQLNAQARAIDAPVEVIVCYNDREIDAKALCSVLQQRLTVPWKLEATGGCEYYELKNRAARVSTGDLLVFVDSDVIPEDGWLSALLSRFDDPAVSVACGSTYIEPDSLYAKAFALFWFFPLRPGRDDVDSVRYFFANDVAFRRATFERYPFLPLAGTSRGSCLLLSERLRANGIHIWRNSAARVSHPAPNGIRHFVRRALAQGRDALLLDRLEPGTPPERTSGSSGKRLMRNLAHSTRQIARRRHQVGVPLWQVPAVALLATSYYSLFFLGEVATIARPGWMVRHFRI